MGLIPHNAWGQSTLGYLSQWNVDICMISRCRSSSDHYCFHGGPSSSGSSRCTLLPGQLPTLTKIWESIGKYRPKVPWYRVIWFPLQLLKVSFNTWIALRNRLLCVRKIFQMARYWGYQLHLLWAEIEAERLLELRTLQDGASRVWEEEIQYASWFCVAMYTMFGLNVIKESF